MRFKYSVIGDNTAENRKHLDKLGYKFRFASNKGRNDYNLIATKSLRTNLDVSYAIADLKLFFNTNDVELIDCRGNDNLFRAVSAMREDKIGSDQYHVLDKDKGHIKDGEFVIDILKVQLSRIHFLYLHLLRVTKPLLRSCRNILKRLNYE